MNVDIKEQIKDIQSSFKDTEQDRSVQIDKLKRLISEGINLFEKKDFESTYFFKKVLNLIIRLKLKGEYYNFNYELKEDIPELFHIKFELSNQEKYRTKALGLYTKYIEENWNKFKSNRSIRYYKIDTFFNLIHLAYYAKMCSLLNNQNQTIVEYLAMIHFELKNYYESKKYMNQIQSYLILSKEEIQNRINKIDTFNQKLTISSDEAKTVPDILKTISHDYSASQFFTIQAVAF